MRFFNHHTPEVSALFRSCGLAYAFQNPLRRFDRLPAGGKFGGEIGVTEIQNRHQPLFGRHDQKIRLRQRIRGNFRIIQGGNLRSILPLRQDDILFRFQPGTNFPDSLRFPHHCHPNRCCHDKVCRNQQHRRRHNPFQSHT
ncbi:hypothetical protein HF882_02535 [Victivallis vadensis]|uniref:Uncharacterized protein n=1 Tax=Victivallis vadensis TaxID=172901 RepID=A0A848AQ99_9BACT|nr:hypothetical protein [Victivallis vadensis]NMD85455.1 hypothetical protein [Victivallis vadensis]